MSKYRFISIPVILALVLSLGVGLTPPQTTAEGGDLPFPVMEDEEILQEWANTHNSAPVTAALNNHRIVNKFQQDPFGAGLSLLSHVNYNAAERDQGHCGNCWVWAGTGVLEIALDVQQAIFDRLSIQFLNSCWGGMPNWACCGGLLAWLADFYDPGPGYGYCIPWGNTNAEWQDGTQYCYQSTTQSCIGISKTPNYPITSCVDSVIPTHGVGQATAIANIKAVLSANKGVFFGFHLPDYSAWYDFQVTFWLGMGETAVWNPMPYCGATYDPSPGQGGGHAVLCVGWDDNGTASNPADDYWIMLNSWGTAGGGRPAGLFRVAMDIDYDCYYNNFGSYYALWWETLDVTFEEPPPEELEFGDAPDDGATHFYPSLAASDGSRHYQSMFEYLGLALNGDGKDYEADAMVPNIDQFDDGLTTFCITAGLCAETVGFEVTDLLAPATDLRVNILIDLNGNGIWEPSEHVVQNQPLSTTDPINGDTFTSLPFSTIGATPGMTWLRITLSATPETVPPGWDGTMAFNGSVPFFCGETEDYEISILEPPEPLEFGDAPDDPTNPNDYPSLRFSAGSSHYFSANEILGLFSGEGDNKDHESDSNQVDADLYDDGLVTPFITTGKSAETITFQVTDFLGSDMIVNILIDLNRDGDWNDPGEHVVQNHIIFVGVGEGWFVSPTFSTVGASAGMTWMRITLTRYTTVPSGWDGSLLFRGTVPFGYGETEDYYIEMVSEDLEYGDAPDPPYPSTLASDGARHEDTRTEFLGDDKDQESDANQPDLDALDDGLLTTTITTGITNQQVQFKITDTLQPSTNLVINILIDLNRDGDWDDAGEHVVQNQPISTTASPQTFFSLPFSTVGAVPGMTWLRITLTRSDLLNLPWDGTMATHAAMTPFEFGETEDWEIMMQAPPEVIPPWLSVKKWVTPTEIWLEGFGMTPEIATVTLSVTGHGQIVDLPNVDIIFALDSSGSMGASDPFGVRRTGSKDFVDSLDPTGDQVGVVSWDDNIDFWLNLTNDFVTAKAWIDMVDDSGGTDLDVGLSKAIDLLDAGARLGTVHAIVFLTDGDGNYIYSGNPGSQADRALLAGYKIYAIGLDPPGSAIPKLQDMANTTGGKYCLAASAGDITDCLADILGGLTNVAGHDVTVIDVLPDYINLADHFTILPDVQVTDPDGNTWLMWYVGTIMVGETWTVSFNISSDECGPGLLVNDLEYSGVYEGIRVIIIKHEGTQNNLLTEFLPFPAVYIDVLCPLEVEPARLIVRNLLIEPANAFPGQQVVISCDVINQGGYRGSKNIELVINGQAEQSTRVGVDPGAREHITFYASKTVPGTYEVFIEGEATAFNVLIRPRVTATGAFEGLGTAAVVAIVVIGVIFLVGIIIVFIRVRRRA